MINNSPTYFNFRRVERSSDQVIKPVNLEALTKWVGNIPEDVVHDMANIAPMLSILGESPCAHPCFGISLSPSFVCLSPGYDPYANPPNYGNAADIVKENTNKVRKRKKVSMNSPPAPFFFILFRFCWFTESDLLTRPKIFLRILRLNSKCFYPFIVQVKNNQKLWDHKVKQLLKRDEETNEENDDNQDDNPNDVERTWWGEWVYRKTSPLPSFYRKTNSFSPHLKRQTANDWKKNWFLKVTKAKITFIRSLFEYKKSCWKEWKQENPLIQFCAMTEFYLNF